MKFKPCTLLLIVAAMLIAVAIPISAYDGEPTDEELAGWWETLSRQERIEQLRLLDRVEHETPEALFPVHLVTVTTDEIVLQPRQPATVSVGHLSWEFTLPEQRTIYEPKQHRFSAEALAGTGALSFVLGSFVGWLIWK